MYDEFTKRVGYLYKISRGEFEIELLDLKSILINYLIDAKPGTLVERDALKVTYITHYGNWTAAIVGSINMIEDELYVLVFDHSNHELLAQPITIPGYKGT